ncbi:MAG: type II secretion system protein F, partial [Sulfobacillus sp.]|nr:type II secretion system protein F [Sulfobacillus sp.]
MPLSSSGWIIVALWPMAVTAVILGVRQRQSANLLARRLALLQTGGLEEAVPVKKPWLQVLTETWNRSQSAAAFNLRWT